MKRIDRLIAILTLLQSRKYTNSDLFVERFNISIRTVYRDIKDLNDLGAPVIFENGRGYKLLQGFFLPPLIFTGEEANAMILMLSITNRYSDESIAKNYSSAMEKIKSVLRETDKENAITLQEHIKIHPTRIESNHFLSSIQQAIINKTILYIEYKDRNDSESARKIEPIGLTYYGQNWHLIAWCWECKNYRDFITNNIKDLTDTGMKFIKTDHLDINSYIKSIS